jgi:tetratricopeptide (TPR) repeat protein
MRITLLAAAMIVAAAVAPSAQRARTVTPEAQRANAHYAQGWKAMRSEAWAEAAREFQLAIDSDPKFKLAYYGLGRSQMALRKFPAAIAAYVACRDMYVSEAGERFSNQLDSRQRIEDRLFEYRALLRDSMPNASSGSTAQSNSLYVRELQTEITRLEQMRDRDINVTVDATVPFFVPMALGAAYFRNGQMPDAEREYKAALASNPNSGETYNNLAVVYLLLGRVDEAEKAIKAAEKTGFKVNPMLKDDIAAAKKKTGAGAD